MEVTKRQFWILCSLLRFKEQTETALHDVFFNGMTKYRASKEHGMHPQNLGRAEKRFWAAHTSLLGAYK